MKSSELITIFKRMLNEHWTYEWGAAREGCVDCSGAFVYAFKQIGKSIAHSSNAIAREYISGGLMLACNAKPGYAVFKWREPNENTPVKYRNDGLGDIYHIGLLDSDGASVLNAKGEKYGFSSDPLSKWQYAAPLKGVQYEEVIPDMEPLGTAVVITDSTSLNLRAAMSTKSAIVGKAAKGSTVTVYQTNCGYADGHSWAYISADSAIGYVAQEYLYFSSSKNTTEPTKPDISENMTTHLKIVDSEGNVFYPIGNFTVEIVTAID